MNFLPFLSITEGTKLSELTCGGADVLKVIQFIMLLLDVLLFIVPIVLIVMISIDFVKSVISSGGEDMAKNAKLAFKRLINCIALFLVQPIIGFCVELIADSTGRNINPISCVYIATHDDLTLYEADFKDADYESIKPGNFIGDEGGYEITESEKEATVSAEDFLESLEKISNEVEKAAKEGNKWLYSNKNTRDTFKQAKKATQSTNCALYVNWALIEIGVMEKGQRFYKCWNNCKNTNKIRYRKTSEAELSEKLEYIDGGGKKASALIKDGTLQAGDIVLWAGHQHTNVYAGDGKWYDAGRQGGIVGSGGPDSFYFTTLGPVKLPTWMNIGVWKILRIKSGNTEKENASNKDTSNKDGSISGTFEIKNKKNLVGIMYSTWFDKILPSNPKIISKTSNLSTNTYYFWGEPAVGFYKSSNKTVIKKHMKQLADAGIDFIILDNTNMNPSNGFKKGTSDWKGYVTTPMTALLDTIVEMRKNNEKTPYVVNWIYTGNNAQNGHVPFETWQTVNSIYEQFYTNEKYEDVWVYWNNKPFIITTSTPTTSASKPITTRSMWGLNGVSSVNWSYLEIDNDKPGKDSKGNIEQIGVSTAMQRNYMSNTSTAVGRNNGLTFYNQWKTAFKYHPKIVTITWWNEWGAINLGNRTFTDLYNQEYSRDIEPMKGGHGDTYYQWMKQYIQAYKNNKTCPKLTGD